LKCPKCHSDNVDTSRFCARCGAVLASQEQPSLSATKTLVSPVGGLARDSLIAGKYRIIEEVGAGGMGVVFRAYDEPLDRDVAIKVLSPASLGDPTAHARLLREARTASRLNHPHICTIHDVGEAEGQTYIAMELVRGQTLRARLAEGPLSPDEILRYARQVADALAHAHAHNVIHRDLKSANIILTPEGRAKVLDFGLAKRLSADAARETMTGAPSLTQPGTVAGTPAYMAPEQLRGQPTDFRTDVWALGVVLYEMAAGTLPFSGSTGYETSAAILNRPPRPLAASAPLGLNAVIARCLEKNPQQRYPDGAAVLAALEALVPGGQRPRSSSRYGWLPRRTLTLAGICGASLALIAALVWLNVGGRRAKLSGKTAAPPGNVRLAVLPFENLTGDPAQEYLSDGLTEEMIAQLGRLNPQRLSVIARTTAMRYKRTEKTLEQIGRELRVAYILEGSLRREAGRVRISVQLIQERDQAQIWADSYERELAGILALQSEVAQGVARSLAITLIPAEQARLTSPRVVQPEAYEQYQMGRFRLAERTVPGLEAAIGHFERAVALDPTYALAYAGLADAQALLPFFSIQAPAAVGRARAEAAANRALALDASLGQAHAALGQVREFEFNWEAAEDHFRRAIDLDPSYASAHHWYADLLARRGRHPEALVQIRKALDLDPLSTVINQDLGYVLTLAGEKEAGIRQYERTLEFDPAFPATWMTLTTAFLESRRFEDAAKAIGRWAELTGHDPAKMRQLVDAASAHDRSGVPQPLPADMDLERTAPPYAIPVLYMALGYEERALDALERGYEQGFFSTVMSILSPLFDPIRSDRRFQALLDKVGLGSGNAA
jgi:TolB-like protein